MTKEEAIKIVRNIYQTDVEKKALETLIPELAESEDERVVKLITDSVFYQYGAGVEYKDVLDYLDRLNGKICGAKINGEPVPVENKSVDIPLAEWSDEDENKLYRIVATLLADKEVARREKPQYSDALCEAYDELIVWLKSLPLNLKKKNDDVAKLCFNEWNEDDEQYLLICKNALQKYQRSDQWDANIIFDWLEKRLKSTYQPKQEWSDEVSRNFARAEEEKADFVGGQFIQCNCTLDNGLKQGEHYWLEYVGDDTYVGRSDNILNKKFYITPRQLFTLFTQQLDEKEPDVNLETKEVGKEWTIEEAKKGDILANQNCVLVFDHLGEFEGKPVIESWFYADSVKFHAMGIPDRWCVYGFHPATPLEVKYLMDRMKEAGYKWDDKLKVCYGVHCQ